MTHREIREREATPGAPPAAPTGASETPSIEGATGELAAALAAVGEGVLVCDADGRVTMANPAVERILGRPPPASFGDLLDALDLPSDTAVARGSGRAELRLRGSDRWIELRRSTLAPEAAGAGRHADDGGFIVVLRDVSRAREASAERDAFIGILSHELRTPITTIYVGSRLLAREPGAPAARRDIAADIEAEAERLFRLVEDLLVVTRSERGALDMVHEPVLVQRVIEAALRLERHRRPETTFVPALPDDLPPVDADSRHVVHVVRNLLANAPANAVDPSTVTVDVREEEGGVAVRASTVTAHVDRPAEGAVVLGEDVQAGPERSAGDGVSLLVCDRLVRAMGGRIWTRDADGRREVGFWLRAYREVSETGDD